MHAYSAAAVSALDAAGRVRAVPYTKCSLHCDYGRYGMVCRLCEKYQAVEQRAEYTEQVEVFFLLPPGVFESFEKELTEQSCGCIALQNDGEKVLGLAVL